MAEVRLERAATKDLRRMGPGPERDRIMLGLRALANDEQNLDVKPIRAAPGWFRLRVGSYRVCYYRAHQEGSDGSTVTCAVERIVPRGALESAIASLPQQPSP